VVIRLLKTERRTHRPENIMPPGGIKMQYVGKHALFRNTLLQQWANAWVTDDYATLWLGLWTGFALGN